MRNRFVFTDSFITIFLFVGILVTINLLSSKNFFRFDLTQDKVYTLSSTTKSILGSLNDQIRIKAYFSGNLPPYLLNLRTAVRELLEEYQINSGGKLVLEFYDPEASEETEQKARSLGVPRIKMGFINKDKREVRSVYLGIVILYEDKKELIHMVRDIKNLEYQVTSAIKKITDHKIPTVAFVSNKNCQTTEISEIIKKLKENFSISTEPLLEGHRIPDRYDTLILPGPKEKLSPRQLYELDQFLMRGKSIIFLLDSIILNKNRFTAIPIKPGLAPMLSSYGIHLGENLVIDSVCATTRFRGQYSPYPLDYVFWPKVIRKNFDLDSPIVNLMEVFVLPWAGQVEIMKNKKTNKLKKQFKTIVRSSSKSWIVSPTYNFSLAPVEKSRLELKNSRSYGLVCLGMGKFKSFFHNKPVPMPDIKNLEKLSFYKNEKRITIKETDKGKLAVVGSSLFINNKFLKLFPVNGVFFRNLVEYITSGDDMISIRSRKNKPYPSPPLKEKEKQWIRWANILIPPFLVIILGMLHFYFRKKEKEIYQTQVSPRGEK